MDSDILDVAPYFNHVHSCINFLRGHNYLKNVFQSNYFIVTPLFSLCVQLVPYALNGFDILTVFI